MGQKTHPIGFRLGIIRSWNSRWFAPDNKFADLIHEDILVKRYINRRLDNAGIANICISRAPKKVTIDIHTSRPGIVIGRKGAEVDKLREELHLLTNKDILLNIVEVRKPELNAQLVGDAIARQLEGRVSFRRAMKKAIAATMKMGAKGIRLQCAGRLGGAEIARTEQYRDGSVPLHTIRADIDYATSTARTTYGCIGIKVWICRGEILETGNFYKTDESKADERHDAGHGGPRGKRGHRGEQDRGRGKQRPRGKIRRRPDRPAGDDNKQGGAPRGRRPERSDRPKSSGRPDAHKKVDSRPKRADVKVDSRPKRADEKVAPKSKVEIKAKVENKPAVQDKPKAVTKTEPKKAVKKVTKTTTTKAQPKKADSAAPKVKKDADTKD